MFSSRNDSRYLRQPITEGWRNRDLLARRRTLGSGGLLVWDLRRLGKQCFSSPSCLFSLSTFHRRPSEPSATVSCRSRKAVAHGENQRSSPISVLSKLLRERLYVLDFRSSCPDWRVFLIHRLTYTLQYEDLNHSR